MGMFVNRLVDEDCRLGIWQITETYEDLISRLNLTPEELCTLEAFLNHQRKLEWLSVRVLINELLCRESRIIYNEDHKPFLFDYSHNISISHSKNFTSILISKKKRVGIDLEFMSHQIMNIAHKFINENEFISEKAEEKKLHLYIHWCAKEALYKICDKQDINFKQNLIIEPFHVNLEGTLKAHLRNIHGSETFLLNYFLLDNYVIVWCTK